MHADVCSPDGFLLRNVVEAASIGQKGLVVDGSAKFIFESLCRYDGVIPRLLLVPRDLDSSRRDLLAAEASGVLVERWESAEKWLGSFPQVQCIGTEFATNESQPLSLKDKINIDFCGSEWVLATSGSTGVAKLHRTHFAELFSGLRSVRRNDRYRWALVYDPARFAGLQVTLQAAISGDALLAVDLDRPIDEQISWLEEMECNAISGTPSWWRRFLMFERSAAFKLKQVTLGGEIVDAKLLDALRKRFPLARITQIYASTEIGVIFTVHDGLPGFPVEYITGSRHSKPLAIDSGGGLWVGRDRSSVGANVTNLNDCLGMSLENSIDRSVVGNGSANTKVRGGDARSAGGYSTFGGGFSDQIHWIETGDLVEVDGDRVMFVGRMDNTINVGGDKVKPERVEFVLRQVSGVSDVLVRGRPSSIMGQLVEAIVVLEDESLDIASAAHALREHAMQALLPYERPALIHFASYIPMSPASKAARRQ